MLLYDNRLSFYYVVLPYNTIKNRGLRMKKNKGKIKETINVKEVVKDKVVTIKLESNILNQVDTYAKKMKLNRSQLLRNFIDIGLDEVKLTNIIGLSNLSTKGYDLLANVKDSLAKKRFSIEGQTIKIRLE